MTDFDAQVRALRQTAMPKHKPYGHRKSDCTPEQWASHLAWQAAYLSRPGHREIHEWHRLRSLAKRSLQK
jgi:hypothetical protein